MPLAPDPTDPADGTPPVVVGWREWVALPQAGLDWVKAKVDTGARSSAIHAFDLEVWEQDGAEWVRFSIHPWQRTREDSVDVELPIHDRRRVRSSTGHVQERYVVLIDVTLVDRTVTAEVTLTSRDQMGFRMLIGREALRQGYLIHSGRSYLGGRPKKAVRRRNRGI